MMLRIPCTVLVLVVSQGCILGHHEMTDLIRLETWQQRVWAGDSLRVKSHTGAYVQSGYTFGKPYVLSVLSAETIEVFAIE